MDQYLDDEDIELLRLRRSQRRLLAVVPDHRFISYSVADEWLRERMVNPVECERLLRDMAEAALDEDDGVSRRYLEKRAKAFAAQQARSLVFDVAPGFYPRPMMQLSDTRPDDVKPSATAEHLSGFLIFAIAADEVTGERDPRVPLQRLE